jgi:hypothetical protein
MDGTSTWTLRAEEAPQQIRENWVGTSWIAEMTAAGTRFGEPFQAQHHLVYKPCGC